MYIGHNKFLADIDIIIDVENISSSKVKDCYIWFRVRKRQIIIKNGDEHKC